MVFPGQSVSSPLSFHRPMVYSGRKVSSSFTTRRSMLFDQLHDEMKCEILSRLPAQYLLRFRCVSKSWRALIDAPNFTKSHLSQNGKTKIFLFSGTEVGLFPSDPNGITLNFKGFDLINNSSKSFKVPLYFPYDLHIRVVGSCNGLFCFVSVSSDVIVLVNPTTRAGYRILPPTIKRVGFCEVGFGYDPITDDYKVVRMQRMGNNPDIEVNIYYLKSKKWRRIRFSSNYNNYLASLNGYYTHGALHWSLHDPTVLSSSRVNESFHIATFDLVKEKLTVVKYDTEMFGNPTCVDLVILGGCLSLYSRRDRDRSRVDVWMMKEYGVKESWFKLVSIDYNVVPLELSKCGRRLLLKDPGRCSLYWYDFENKAIKYTGTRFMRTSGCHVCLQSLIRLS